MPIETGVRGRTVDWRVIAVCGLVVSVLLALRTPDIDSENIGNWFYAKLFLLDLGFIDLARSPLYQLYLVPFSLMPHPLSIVVERTVSVFLCFLPVAAVMWLSFGRGIGLAASVFAAPDVLLTTPTTQAFALAAICLALYVRMRRPFTDVSNVNAAYALMLVAWLFRTNTIVVLGVVVAYDLFGAVVGHRWRNLLGGWDPRRHWPVAAVALAVVVFATFQSPHPWNTYQQIDMTWQPHKGQMATVISHMVANHFRYREPETGGLPFDAYFMHKKFFGDAETVTEMVRANPGELVRHVWRNTGGLLTTTVSMTNVGQVMLRFTGLIGQGGRGGPLDHRYVAVGLGVILVALFAIMMWHLWSDHDRRELSVFVVGFVATMAVAGLLTNGTATRILHVLYGAYMVLGAYWAERIVAWIKTRRGLAAAEHAPASRRIAAAAGAALVLFLLTQGGWARAGAGGWGGVVWRVEHPVKPDSGNVFYDGKNDVLFKALNREWPRCRGLITAEMPQFVGAFSEIPHQRLYSPFEIPPFGRLGQSEYTGLRKDRVNCLYAPDALVQPRSASITNIKLRYDLYIGPYMQRLLADGAMKIVLPLGVLVIAE